jgi:hypothetical protein
MEKIENFAAISPEEQRAFAEALVKTINSEHTFTSEADFKIFSVTSDDHTGDLIIDVEALDLINVPREAVWNIYDEDELHQKPEDDSDIDYVDLLRNDAKKAFKTLSVEIEGYTVTLDTNEVDEEETVEVEVTNYSEEDAGIGSYEYWGDIGYDSRPYFEVEGTIVNACSITVALTVSPVVHVAEIEAEEEI